jgi:FkbM family methyltransferase
MRAVGVERAHLGGSGSLNPLFRIARRAQGVADLLPKRWRLPLRYQVQNAIGGLEPEFSVLPRLVPRDSIALDIGANMGVYSYALARLARHVHAFEPQVDCCEVVASWATNRNVTVHNAGVGSEAGELVLHVPLDRGRKIGTRASFTDLEGPHEDIRVPVIAIDSLDLGHIGFIKIDVEGFEHDVLIGAAGTLRRCQPALLIELDRKRQSRESFQRTLALLGELGYAASVFAEGRLKPCGDDVWEAAEKHYNFIFTAAASGGDRRQADDSAG